MSYSVKEIAPKELDKFIAKEHPEVNFLQYSDWGKVHEVEGKPVKYLGLFDGDKLIGSAVIIRQDARRGRYYEIPGGPIVDWDGSIKPIRFFIEEIKKNSRSLLNLVNNIRRMLLTESTRRAGAKASRWVAPQDTILSLQQSLFGTGIFLCPQGGRHGRQFQVNSNDASKPLLYGESRTDHCQYTGRA